LSAPPRTLRAGHTHLYPGARLRGEPAVLRRGQTPHIEFADLGSAPAIVEVVESGRTALTVGAHRTARGTAVAAKRWLIEMVAAGEWRVLKRLPGDG
jgi:hypothetical protein